MNPKSWREVIAPHPDVSSGRYRQAEFAVNLADVLMKRASPEHSDAAEFFSRTYLTSGMSELMTEALQRLSGGIGVPVVQLKTAFGGGATLRRPTSR